MHIIMVLGQSAHYGLSYCGNGFGVYKCSGFKGCTANSIGEVTCSSPTKPESVGFSTDGSDSSSSSKGGLRQIPSNANAWGRLIEFSHSLSS